MNNNIKINVSFHISDEELAKFFDGKINKLQSEHFINHLNNCNDCYDKFVEVYHLLSDKGNKTIMKFENKAIKKALDGENGKSDDRDMLNFPKRFTLKPVISVLAIFLFVAIGVLFFYNSDNLTPTLFRSGKVAEYFNYTYPEDNETISTDAAEFKWNVVKDTYSYHFYLFNESGDIVYDKFTGENKITVPESAIEQVSSLGFWQVEAILKNAVKIKSQLYAIKVQKK